MVNDLSFKNDEGIVKKNGAEACRSDNDDYSDSEKACINSALNILVYANNTEKNCVKSYIGKDIVTRQLIQR